jgi:hypothetical protein
LRLGKGADRSVQRDPVANRHHIDVAARRLSAVRHGAINERNPDFSREPEEALSKHFGDTESLPHDSAQLLEYRAVAVGLEVSLPAFHCTCEDSGGDQLSEFPLHGARSRSQRVDNLPLIEALVGVAEQKPEHGLSRGAE